MTITLELTKLQAEVVRNAFLPANPNKLRAVAKVLNPDTGNYEAAKYDGKTLKQLAHEVIAALAKVDA